MISPSFESFNARNLTPEEVAQTFIPSKDYEDLWKNDHTVVLGPRGSGKTTLFKMLTVQALHSWDSQFAMELRQSRAFTAIYVPTDMHWHHQLKHGENRLSQYPRLQAAVSRCAVTTSILLAIIKTFQSRLMYEAPQLSSEENKVSRYLIESWKINNSMPTFELIALALKARISHIRSFVNACEIQGVSDATYASLPSYYHMDYFAEMDLACSAFDSVFKLPQSKKWALCLDEMELAPEWLQSLALSQVRSSDQNYLIKISTSPIPIVAGETSAQPKQDFQLISIWNYPGRDSQVFAQQLATSVLNRKFGPNITPESLLGTSKLLQSEESQALKYERGSAEWKLFVELAKWDDSFRGLLEHNGLNPDDPSTDDITIRDTFLRKAKPIALFRSAFLKKTGGKLWFRSRKVSGFYCGADAVFRISDGNPRRLIGIINDISAKVRKNSDGSIQPLSENEQDEILNKASLQFRGYINALPDGTAKLGDKSLDLITILKAIATYFRQGLLGEEFPLDPKGSFIVDSNLTPQVVELIRLGVYHGAIVHVDPLPDAIETSVIDKRFRLSYMLAPVARLPLTLYGEVPLSKILKASSPIKVKSATRFLEQPQLPL